MAEAVAQFRKALDQLALLPTPLNVSDRSSNSAAHWVQHCASSKVSCCYAKGIPKLLRSCIAKPRGLPKSRRRRSGNLRAAMSLARLRRDQGRSAEACELLGPIYGSFTEGFDAPDLEEVNALLDELS